MRWIWEGLFVGGRDALAEYIAHARERRGLTQPQLADQVGVDRQQVYKWEKRRALPARRNIPALASALDVPADELYGLLVCAKDDDLAAVKRENVDLRQTLDEAVRAVEDFNRFFTRWQQ